MIRFVYFDLGGVVIDDFSGHNSWQELKDELGILPEIEEAFDEAWLPLEQEVLVGRDIESLVPVFRQQFNLTIPETYSLLGGFVSRFKANPPIWPSVKLAKEKAGIGLLTNAYPGMYAATMSKGILPPAVQWDVIVDSSIEKLKKPDLKLFTAAELKAGAEGTEILFIDNSMGHVKAARSYGWQAYHYDATDHVRSSAALHEYLNKHL